MALPSAHEQRHRTRTVPSTYPPSDGLPCQAGDSLPLLLFKALCGAAYIDPRALRFVKEIAEGETQVVELATLIGATTIAAVGLTPSPCLAVAEGVGGGADQPRQEAVAGGGTPSMAVAGGGTGQPRQVVVKSYRPHIVGSPQEMRTLVKAAVHMHMLASSPEYR